MRSSETAVETRPHLLKHLIMIIEKLPRRVRRARICQPTNVICANAGAQTDKQVSGARRHAR